MKRVFFLYIVNLFVGLFVREKAKRRCVLFTFQEAKLIVGLILGIMSVMLLPLNSHAMKKLPPIKIDLAFQNHNPGLGSVVPLFLAVTPEVDVPHATIDILLPKGILLLGGGTTWSGALNRGETTSIVIYIQIVDTGRCSIMANVRCYSSKDVLEENLLFGRRAHLNMIITEQEVSVSTDPFILMDLERAQTPEAKANLHKMRGIEVATHSSTKVIPPTLPDLFMPKEENTARTSEETRLSSDAGIEDTITVTVSGKMTYKDSAGNEHPIRYAKVQVIDVDVAVDDIMGNGFTGADGSYSIVATGGDVGSGPDIKVKVFAAIVSDLVASVGIDLSSTYSMESSTRDDFTGSALTISLTTGTPVSGSTTDSNNARIFSVLDAVLQFAIEAYGLLGGNLMEKIRVVFPGTGTSYSPFEADPLCPNLSHLGRIRVLRADALDWDVIGHEYGHFVADRGASTNFDQSCGGSHSGGTTIPANGKSDGINLAWSEGWGTFFSIATQVDPSSTAFGLVLPNIPNTGDRIYHDTEDGTVTDDLETIGDGALTGSGQGYSSENSVVAALYDLIDGNTDSSPDSTAKDSINATPKDVWNVLNTGDWDNVGKFFNKFVDMFLFVNLDVLIAISDIFAMNNIAPELQEPANEEQVSSAISPTFKWQENGDPTAGFEHNNFAIAIFKDNFDIRSLVMYKDGITTNEYTFSDSDWETIIQASGGNANTVYKWIVIGYNDKAPIMPLAGGVGGFISNFHTFTARALHIRLTWNNLGADVDLHLRPPDGASSTAWDYSNDCAYYNETPDWGVPGDTTDNPSLDRDCITSCTEENITLDKITESGTYKVLAHYFRDHDKGASTARVEIFQNGISIFDQSRTLTNSGDEPDTGQIWTVLSVTIPDSGAISSKAIDEIATRRSTKPLPEKYRKDE